ncbi:MAG TPA: diacylglycerol kinase family protein [Candidatus Acidoferrales bacterium]
MSPEKTRFLAIVNPAAGGGRCGTLAPAALARVKCSLEANGAGLEVVHTKRRGEATDLTRAAYRGGIRHFLAVGGDGTSYEIINGVFPESSEQGRISLGFLPLGTGNSFLRDFTTKGVEHTTAAIAQGRSRSCDVIRARHSAGEIYFINVLNLGFPADVAELTNRRFKPLGETGYILAVFGRLAWLFFETFPHRVDSADWDRRPSLFLAFTNTKFTGGKMMIAPKADSANGKIEYVRWAPIGRARLLWLFPRLFTGTHINHPLATRAAVEHVEFDLREPVNVVVDGENMKLQLQSLEILPNALDVTV